MGRLLPDAPPVRLIPASDAMLLLSQKACAVRARTDRSVQPVFRRPASEQCRLYLVALTFYATIFGKNPVGLPVGGYQAQPGNPAANVQITPALCGVFQETVWEVVASHPLTGVTAADPLRVATPWLDPAVVDEPYAFELSPAFGRALYRWRLAHGSFAAGIGRDAHRPDRRPPDGGRHQHRVLCRDRHGGHGSDGGILARRRIRRWTR